MAAFWIKLLRHPSVSVFLKWTMGLAVACWLALGLADVVGNFAIHPRGSFPTLALLDLGSGFVACLALGWSAWRVVLADLKSGTTLRKEHQMSYSRGSVVTSVYELKPCCRGTEPLRYCWELFAFSTVALLLSGMFLGLPVAYCLNSGARPLDFTFTGLLRVASVAGVMGPLLFWSRGPRLARHVLIASLVYLVAFLLARSVPVWETHAREEVVEDQPWARIAANEAEGERRQAVGKFLSAINVAYALAMGMLLASAMLRRTRAHAVGEADREVGEEGGPARQLSAHSTCPNDGTAHPSGATSEGRPVASEKSGKTPVVQATRAPDPRESESLDFGTSGPAAAYLGATAGRSRPTTRAKKVVVAVLLVVALLAAAFLWRRWKAEASLSAAGFVGEGHAYTEAKQYDGALSAYQKAIDRDPELPAIYFFRGMTYLDMQQLDKAIADFTKAIRLNSVAMPLALRGRGRAYFLSDQLGDAVADFTAAIEADPSMELAYCYRGLALNQMKEYARAIPDFDEAIRLKADSPTCHVGRAWAHYEMGRMDEAVRDCTEGIRLDHNSPAAHQIRGQAYHNKREFDKAISDFTRAIDLGLKLCDSYESRASAHAAKKEFARACEDYAEAIRLGPKDLHSLNSFAWLLATCPDPRFRDGKRAVELATRACALSEWKQTYTLDTLAAAHAEAGDFDQAVERQQRVLELLATDDPEVGKARQRLARYEGKKPYRDEE